MSLIDFILNVAGLLLWLNWRSVGADPFARGKPATLSGTLRRAQPMRFKRSYYLAALAVLLFVRAVFYWLIGPEVNWVPKLDLFFVALTFHFRDSFSLSPLLFSLLSFLRVFLVFHFWLLTLAALNRREAGTDPIQKLISLQLARLARWPWYAQLAVPVLATTALWIVLHPALVYVGATARVNSFLPLAGQGLLVGSALFLSLKQLLPAFLAVHLVASYVYLGASPLWDFAGATSRNLLRPLRRLPLRVGKIDLAPIVGIVLILLALHALPDFALRHLTLWPQ